MPANGTLEEQVRQRYHQPKGVEQFGIEPIPDRLKTVRWFDLFLIVVNFLINPGTILISGLAVASGLSFTEAVASQVCGVVIAFGAYVAMATIGVDYGVPGQVATRMAYGLRGAKWAPSLLRTAASIYWFAFQTVAGSMAVVAVLDKWLGGQHSLVWVSIIFAALQVAVALVGYESLKVLSRFAFPLKLVVFAYLFVLLAWQGGPDFAPSRVVGYAGLPGPHWLLFATWLNGAAAAWLTMITDAADFCRYSRTRVDMWLGTLSAAAVGSLLGALLGAYAAAGTLGRIANPFEVVAQLSTSGLTLLLVFVVIAFDNWTINVLNLYTGGLSLSNIAERLGRFWTTLAVSVLGVALSAVPDVVNGYTGYMNVLGNIFAPMAGVLIADYVFLKRTRVDVVALFEPGGPYWYWRGFGLAAIGWTVVGFVIYLAVPMAWVPTAVTPVVTGLGYYATVRLLSGRFPTLARAGRPGEQRESVDELDQELVMRGSPGPGSLPMIDPRPRDLIGYGRTRPHAAWPGDARVAVSFVLNYEEGGERSVMDGDPHAETYLTPEIVGLAPKPGRSFSVEDHFEYGSRAGFWRILRLFQERGLPFTCWAVGLALTRNPDAGRAMAEAGHEVASHSWRWIDYAGMPEAQERDDIRRTVRAIQEITGTPPLGWYTGRYSENTRRLVMEETATLYDSDSYNDDLPYWVEVAGKPRLIVPYALDTNDFKFATSPGWMSGEDFFAYLKAAFDQLYREGADEPKMMSIGLHCRLTGRPARAAALGRFMDYVMRHERVWVCRRVEIARHWMEKHPAAAVAEQYG